MALYKKRSCTEITDGLGMPLQKFVSISKNDTRAELNLGVIRMNPLPTTLLLKIESTSKQTCFENGTDIKIILYGKFIIVACSTIILFPLIACGLLTSGATQTSFQLKILHVGNCLDWIVSNTSYNINLTCISCRFTRH